MRSFDSQVTLFFWMDQSAKTIRYPMPDRAVAHAYVVDIFLWKMASMGYTLQKSHCQYDFLDPKVILNKAKNDLDDHRNKMIGLMVDHGKANNVQT